MTNKINFKLLKPFGSTLAKAELPLQLVSEFLKDLKQIREDKEKSKRHDFGNHLVGAVTAEYLITPELMLKWKQQFFNAIISKYVISHYPHKTVKNIKILSAWFIISVSGDQNPQHTHTNFGKDEDKQPHLSCVGFLQIPKIMEENNSNEKNHHKINGKTQFSEGSESFFNNSIFTIDPQVKDWFLFPANLLHSVFPFYSENPKDERISFSFNTRVEFEDGKVN